METCLGDLQLNGCMIYLDDIVFAATPEEHLQWLHAVFEKLKVAGLKLNFQNQSNLPGTNSFKGRHSKWHQENWGY